MIPARLCNLAREVLAPMHCGAVVRIEEGAFAGHSATVDRCDAMATAIALALFGRLVPLLVPCTSVVEIALAA